MSESLTRTISGQLTTRLRDRILSGAYAPGTPLLQDTIAAEFGVSKIPVREALVQLRGEGLVDIFAHRGFQVRPLSASELNEVFRLRLGLEPAAAAEGGRVASDADRSAVRAALLKLNAISAEQPDIRGAQHRAFHLALIVPRLQPVTAEILGRLHALAQRYVQVHITLEGRFSEASSQHTALYEAWRDSRSEEVIRLMRHHIEQTRDEVLADYFSAGAPQEIGTARWSSDRGAVVAKDDVTAG